MRLTGKKDNLEVKVESFFLDYGIKAARGILLGLSGGSDSVGLASILCKLSDKLNISIACAYLDHGIREEEERKREGEFVKKLANELGVELYTGRVKPEEIVLLSKREGRSLEEIARKERYSFFYRVLDEHSFDYLALGHTLDDQIETVIMRFFQGSSSFGLSGIPPVRGKIIRPLIFCSKQEIIDYLQKNQIGYLTDSSNLEPVFLRNRIRLELIPVVERIFPGFRSVIQSFAEKMTFVNDFIKREARAKLTWEKTDRGFRMPAVEFFNLPPVLRLYSLYELYDLSTEKKTARLPYRFLRPVIIESSFKEGQTVLKNFGIHLFVRGKYLFWEKDVVANKKKSYLIVAHVNNKYKIDKEITLHIRNVTLSSYKGSNPWLFEDEIVFPLVIRSRMPGDNIIFDWGKKSLKKLFNDWKVTPELRQLIPVLEDRRGILAVLGEFWGFQNRFSSLIEKKERRKDSSLIVFSFFKNRECRSGDRG